MPAAMPSKPAASQYSDTGFFTTSLWTSSSFSLMPLTRSRGASFCFSHSVVGSQPPSTFRT